MDNLHKFFTLVQTPSFDNKILKDSKVMTIGSCFSDNIGSLLKNHGFDASSNPFSTLYNPVSIVKLISMALNGHRVDISDIKGDQTRSFHYDFHSSFDSSEPMKVKDSINNALSSTSTFMESMDVLIITFGTSIVYKLMEENKFVSNCHKMPSKLFRKEMLSEDRMLSDLESLMDRFTKSHPNLQVILTVSPVRHIKEGIVQNSLSKARLVSLCHSLMEKYAFVSYFPAFEIMMDELRDYRFYEVDLIHPNQQAVEIIWSRFIETYFDDKAIGKVSDFISLNAAVNHRPFDVASENHQKFIGKQLSIIENLKVKYPECNFQPYENKFKKQVI